MKVWFFRTRKLVQSPREVSFGFLINWTPLHFDHAHQTRTTLPPPLPPFARHFIGQYPFPHSFSPLFILRDSSSFLWKFIEILNSTARDCTIAINNSWNASGTINKLREAHDVQKSIHLLRRVLSEPPCATNLPTDNISESASYRI